MDYKAVLKADLDKGFSKSQLEKLIGLPQNNLASFLLGTRSLSKISMLKIERWDASEKPNPLEISPYKKEIKGVVNVVDEQGNKTSFNPAVFEDLFHPGHKNTEPIAAAGKAVTVNITKENHLNREVPKQKKEMPKGLDRIAQMRWLRENP